MIVRKRRSLRLGFESLEGRIVPSTLTVLNGADSGAGSLRQAILNAASGDTIVFSPSVHSITLTSGELDVTKSLTIAGPGATSLSVSGDASRAFHIEPAATVRISSLTITHGKAGPSGGGGVLNAGTMDITGSIISNNLAAAPGPC